MNILITGGLGGIGSVLGPHLFSKGHNITALDNLSGGYIKNNFDGQDFIRGDVNFAALPEILNAKKIDAIIHLAAITSLPQCEENPSQCYLTNTCGTLSVLEAARKNKTKVVFASTSAIYENNTTFPFLEEDLVSPTLSYPLSKKHAEDFCRSYTEKFDLDVTVLRLFNVFGPNQDIHRKSPPLINYIVKELCLGRRPTLHCSGDQKRDYVHVDDVCAAFEKSLTYKGGTYNVCSGRTISVKEIYEIIKQELRSELGPEFKPPSNFWKGYDIFINPELIAKEINKHSVGSNEKIYREMGVKIRSDFENLMADTARKITERYF